MRPPFHAQLLRRKAPLLSSSNSRDRERAEGFLNLANITSTSELSDAELEKMLAVEQLSDMDEKLMSTELKEIKDQMIATLRRRRKLIKKLGDLSSGDTTAQFKGKIKTYCTAEEYNMTTAVRRVLARSPGAQLVQRSPRRLARTISRHTQANRAVSANLVAYRVTRASGRASRAHSHTHLLPPLPRRTPRA